MFAILKNILFDLQNKNADVRDMIYAIFNELAQCDDFGYDPCLKAIKVDPKDGSTKIWGYIHNDVWKTGTLAELKADRA